LCVEIFEEVHQGVIVEIIDVTKARPERVTLRPFQQRLQWIAPLNTINQRITTSNITYCYYLPSGQIPVPP